MDDADIFEVYEDEDGEYLIVDGQRIPFDGEGYEEIPAEHGGPESDDVFDQGGSEKCTEEAAAFLEVYEDEDGEYLIVDGQRIPFDGEGYEEVAQPAGVLDVDSPNFNPLAYESVQVATVVANDLARAGGSIAREGASLANDAAAIAGELKGAMDDIGKLLDPKEWLK